MIRFYKRDTVPAGPNKRYTVNFGDLDYLDLQYTKEFLDDILESKMALLFAIKGTDYNKRRFADFILRRMKHSHPYHIKFEEIQKAWRECERY